jgi:hypothetical protein
VGPCNPVDDGWVAIIERIHARGALIKVLDKPHLDLTTPIGRGFIMSALAFRARPWCSRNFRPLKWFSAKASGVL